MPNCFAPGVQERGPVSRWRRRWRRRWRQNDSFGDDDGVTFGRLRCASNDVLDVRLYGTVRQRSESSRRSKQQPDRTGQSRKKKERSLAWPGRRVASGREGGD